MILEAQDAAIQTDIDEHSAFTYAGFLHSGVWKTGTVTGILLQIKQLSSMATMFSEYIKSEEKYQESILNVRRVSSRAVALRL